MGTLKEKRNVDGRTSYRQLENIFNVRIDTAYKTVYIYSDVYKAFVFNFKFLDKKDLIKELKEIYFRKEKR